MPALTPFIVISNTDASYRVVTSSIVYAMGCNSSTEFYLSNNQTLVSSRPLLYYENCLSAHNFIRVHQSALVNVAYIHCIGKGDDNNCMQLTTGQKIQIARSKRKEVLSFLKQQSIESAPKPEKL